LSTQKISIIGNIDIGNIDIGNIDIGNARLADLVHPQYRPKKIGNIGKNQYR